MRVDVVAAPVRYPRGPLLLLLIIAIVPAIGLLVLHEWAQAEADVYDDSRGAVADIGGPNGSGSVGPALPTPVLNFRRTPESNADQASANRLRQELRSLWQFLDDNSCGAVSVDGLDVSDKNPSTPVLPASNQKLITAAVALEPTRGGLPVRHHRGGAPPAERGDPRRRLPRGGRRSGSHHRRLPDRARLLSDAPPHVARRARRSPRGEGGHVDRRRRHR